MSLPPVTPEADDPYLALSAQALRAELWRRDQQAAAQTAAHEEFLRAVSHDLRAPLRHITSYGPLVRELLEEAGLAGEALQEAQSFLGTMDRSARRMGGMLDALLALAQIARAPLHPQPVDLGGLLEDVRRTLAPAAGARAVEWLWAPDLPRVQADPALLRQLFTELLANALKFTRGREPAQIRVTGARLAEGRTTLRVQDNGVGFNPAQSQGLFGLFQRLHREGEFEGVGAGLARVQAIAQRHGAHVQAQAVPGEGCTLTLDWPAAETAIE
ncbi:MAG: ATP-binding protein [Burkholderiaceae bacterium]|nr:ATP-binding protein [Burkholderiaceae bacterium]